MHQHTPDQGPPDSDAALLARLRAGEDAAFDELVIAATPRMLAVARRMLSREEDAHDAVQEAFLNAFKALPAFDGRSLLTTWLHRITVNACLMRLRSARRRPERSIGDMLPQFVDDGHQARPAQPWKPAGAAGIEHAELLATVRELIDQLPDQYRTILILRDVEELDTDETAVVLGLTPAAVKTRLHRARQALRELLDPHMTAALPPPAPSKAHSRGA
jgi:RNA polymerase sigma-70 factor (ECF subfamily)